MFYNRKPTSRRGYLFDSTKPLWPFGYGLSYTTFTYGSPRVSTSKISAAGRTTLSVDVTNAGARAGDEVVQLYVRDRVSRVTRPLQELRGFRRITLKPGETQTVTFDVDAKTLGYYGPAMKWVVEPGTFDLMVGGSSAAVKSVPLEVQAGQTP
jgi:beta-glucosidase